MSETPAAPEAPQGDPAEGVTAPEATEDSAWKSLPEWAQEKFSKVQGEAKNLRQRIKTEYEPIAQKYREIEDAQKTELQKAQEAIAARDAELTKLQTEYTRTQIAAKYNLDPEVAELLSGSPEEMEAKADRLAQRFSTRPPVPTGTPTPTLGVGPHSPSPRPFSADDYLRGLVPRH